MSNTTQKQVIDLLRRSSKILVMPSSPPDGDSIGSALALYLSLHKLGKEITIVCRDPVPELLRFLPNIKNIGDQMSSSSDFVIEIDPKNAQIGNIKTVKENGKMYLVISPSEGKITEEDIIFNKGKVEYDLIITADTADVSQLGDLYENNIEMFHQVPVVNIDHHVSNSHFGRVNLVDIMASSTTELLLPLLEDLSKEEGIDLIDEDIATLLLTGIITDTGSFQNANTTPKSFGRAAQLISYGARQQEIIQHIYKTKQLSQLKLWGRVLSKIQTDDAYKVVWSVVSQQDFKDTESCEEETGDIIDELMTNAPGAEIVLLIKEKKDGTISVSVRTTSSSIDASGFAEQFGGGGHTQAAGFRVDGKSLRDGEYDVIKAAKKFQAHRLGIVEEEEGSATLEPMINVEELMKRAHEAQVASDMIEQANHKEEEKEEPEPDEIIPKPEVEKAKTKKNFIPTKQPKDDGRSPNYKFES